MNDYDGGYPSPGAPTPSGGRSWRYILAGSIGAVIVLVIIGGVALGWFVGRSSREIADGGAAAAASTTALPSPTTSDLSALTTLPLSTEQLVERVQSNVVLIETGGGSGSGFLVGDGEVMTSAHVVEGSRQVGIQYGKEQRVTGTVEHLDADRDLALISVPSLHGEPLVFFEMGTLKAGSECVVIGSPLGLDQSVSRGIVSNPDRRAGEVRLIQIDAPVNPGNSGGPIMDHEGQVIGIVTLKLRGTEGMGFGVAYDELRSFLTESHNGRWAYSPGSGGPGDGSTTSGGSGDWTRDSGWTVVVASIAESDGGRAEAAQRAAALTAQGYPGGVLYSGDFRSLNPGYWVTFSGQFGTKAEAYAHAQVLRAAGYSDCYQREIAR
jgi:S1-C subfamily serine protease